MAKKKIAMVSKEPKKKKNIKHGMLALIYLFITVILIIVGIYFYGQRNSAKNTILIEQPQATTYSR